MAQENEITEYRANRQPDLEAGFLDWLSAFGTDASIDDLARSMVPVVEAAKDPQA